MPQNTKRRGKLCERQGCNKARHFGHKKGEGGMQFCGAHKEPGMVNLSRKTCEFEGCARPASHGCPIQRKKICCSTHSKKGMVNLLMRVCLHPGCGKSANSKGGGADGDFLYCGTHKKVVQACEAQRPGVVDENGLVSDLIPDANALLPKNLSNGLQTREQAPAAILANSPVVPLHQLQHQPTPRPKSTGKLCEHEGCNKARHYGHKDEGLMRFCGTHREWGMVNLSRKICELEGCARPATHGCSIQRKKVYCLSHKKKGMINLALKRCLHPGCSVSANYSGPSNDGRRLYCFKHKGHRVQHQAAVQRSLPTTTTMAQHAAGYHSSTPAVVGTGKGHPVNVPVAGKVPRVAPSLLSSALSQATSRCLSTHQHPPVNYVRLPYEVLVPVVQAPLPLYLQGQSHFMQFLHPTSLLELLPHLNAPSGATYNDATTQDAVKEEEDNIDVQGVPPTSSKTAAPPAAEENLPAAPQLPKTQKRGRFFCEWQGCKKARHFGHKKGEGGKRFCGAHKEPGMVNLSRKTCEFEGCARPASHGCPIQRKKICCSTHSKKGMVNLLMQVCLHPGCGKSAKFKGGADGKFLYCGTHKEVTTQSKAKTIFEAQQVMIKKKAKHCENDSSSIPTMPGSGCCLPVTTTVTKDVIEVKLPENSEEDRRTPVSRKNRAQKHPRKTDRRKEEALPTCGDDSFPLKKVKTIIAANNTSCSKTSTNGHTSWGSLWGKISA